MKKRIVCFGDSNTWGYNSATGGRFDEDTRWTARLQALLGNDYTVIEEGLNGRTTVWDDPVENRMSGLRYLQPCIDSHAPFDLIILMLGTNDTKFRYGVRARSIANSAERLVKIVAQSDAGRDYKAPQILLVAPFEIMKRDSLEYLFDADSCEVSKGFAEEFRAVAERNGCHFMNAAAVTKPCDLDGLHLDGEGHRVFAQVMAAKVKEILG